MSPYWDVVFSVTMAHEPNVEPAARLISAALSPWSTASVEEVGLGLAVRVRVGPTSTADSAGQAADYVHHRLRQVLEDNGPPGARVTMVDFVEAS